MTVDKNETESHGVFTYCKGSDGKWYVKADETNNYSGRKYSDGTSVAKKSDNSYKWFRVEPIKWRVLTVNYDHDKDFSTTGVKLLLAENVLTGMHFLDSSNWCDSHVYEKSDVRAWLTGTFYNSAFSTSEQAAIMTSTLDGLDVYYNTDATVTDKVFLLSLEEAATTDYGFAVGGPDSARVRDITDFAKAVCTYNEWWLRTCDGSMLFTVDLAGCIFCDSCVCDDNVGVVPALCVAN